MAEGIVMLISEFEVVEELNGPTACIVGSEVVEVVRRAVLLKEVMVVEEEVPVPVVVSAIVEIRGVAVVDIADALVVFKESLGEVKTKLCISCPLEVFDVVVCVVGGVEVRVEGVVVRVEVGDLVLVEVLLEEVMSFVNVVLVESVVMKVL